jgi:HPt (histidine-containing phosphotransfer) domain-containing protein
MNPADPRIVAALAELREQYARELPDLIAALTAVVARLGVDPAAESDAKAQAHRLRGTSGSYGFADVSEAVARLEQALSPPVIRGDVDAAIGAVRAAIPLVAG